MFPLLLVLSALHAPVPVEYKQGEIVYISGWKVDKEGFSIKLPVNNRMILIAGRTFERYLVDERTLIVDEKGNKIEGALNTILRDNQMEIFADFELVKLGNNHRHCLTHYCRKLRITKCRFIPSCFKNEDGTDK
jgi:hypothetical protein